MMGEAAHASRYEATRALERKPFVGRVQEIALLTDRWRDAVEGEGQAVLLTGEAGIGKLRIMEELRATIGDGPHLALLFHCSPHRTNDAFHPIIGQLRRLAQNAAGGSPQTSIEKLHGLVADQPLQQPNAVPLLAAMLSLPLDGGQVPDLPPSEAKEQFMRLPVDLFLDLARDKPMFALIEDAHWIDHSTREVLGRAIGRLADARTLLVVTHRPEADLPPSSHPLEHRFTARTASVRAVKRCSGA